jgi:tetratricopeptide (TPR) repeat protein
MKSVATPRLATKPRGEWPRRLLESLLFAAAAVVLCNLPLVSSRPTEALAQTNLGIALAQEGHLALAEARFRDAIRLAPRRAEAHNHLGVLLVSTGRTCEGIAEFRAALRIQPTFRAASDNLARALSLTGGKAPRAGANGSLRLTRRRPNIAGGRRGRLVREPTGCVA